MSWDQGVMPRDELPEWFLDWADAQKDGPLEYITWFATQPDRLILDYGDAGSLELETPSKRPPGGG